jgi:hypothetical protein
MLGSVALVRADVSEELSASFIRVTRISEIAITLAVTSNLISQEFSKSSVFWDVKQSVGDRVTFLMIMSLHLQGRTINSSTNQNDILKLLLPTLSVVYWINFLATDPEAPGSIPGAKIF